MPNLCSEPKTHYCSSCLVKNCPERKKENTFKDKTLECNGNCYDCDGAIGHVSYLPDSVSAREVLVCNIYHVQTHHDVTCIANPNPEHLGHSKIESVNSRISKCVNCKYSALCELISKNVNFTLEDVKQLLKINFNCKNEVILESIQKEKLYAFCICEELQVAFKDLQIESLQNYIEMVKK